MCQPTCSAGSLYKLCHALPANFDTFAHKVFGYHQRENSLLVPVQYSQLGILIVDHFALNEITAFYLCQMCIMKQKWKWNSNGKACK